MSQAYRHRVSGPYTVLQINEGDRLELSNGRAIYCAPAGGTGSASTLVGGELLSTDPAVESAGIDTGFTPDGLRTLRAPDIAIGGVVSVDGWVKGAPTLAVEYAGIGQDEPELQRKIIELLNFGTKVLWVVRLIGERRVEVYEKGAKKRVVKAGGELRAPGILRNPVPVDALYDRAKAHELVLRNLLQREGYEGLEEVRDEARGKGRALGELVALRGALRDVLQVRGFELTPAHEARVEACVDAAALSGWHRRAVLAGTVDDVFA